MSILANLGVLRCGRWQGGAPEWDDWSEVEEAGRREVSTVAGHGPRAGATSSRDRWAIHVCAS